jgi:signal transduction histidine kinase
VTAGVDQNERLIWALMEQLKMPLLEIAHHAELAHQDSLREVGITAERAIGLVDNYLLATRLQQQTMQFEPVSVSSLLYDVAAELAPMAKQYNCDLELRLDGKYEPVMAHREGMKAALVTLGQSFIESETDERPLVILAGYKSRNGITAGLFAENAQPAISGAPRALTATNAGLYVADTILRSMSTKLYRAQHHKLKGLAATFMPSRQLQLV